MAIEFLIVGGGIGGAVLANLLGRRGKRVLVLERSRAPSPQNRPEVLWPATVKTLQTLIPASQEECWLLPLQGATLTFGSRPLLQFGPEVFQAPGVQPSSTANTRQLLLEQAPCEQRRGVEVTQLLRDRGRVVGVRARETVGGGEVEILAEWTVGDDGVHSVIRRSCGLPMTVVPLPIEMLGFTFDWPASLPAGSLCAWINTDRLPGGLFALGAIPLPEGKGVVIIAVWREAFQDERRLRQALRAVGGQQPQLAELLAGREYAGQFTRFRIGWGRTPRFGVAGALLMGDAAHPVTPAGGQGANASVADALAIAEAACERPGELLAEYERRRAAATQRSLSLSRTLSTILALPRPLLALGLAASPWVARWVSNRPERFRRALRTAAEAFREEDSPKMGVRDPAAE
jgi:2-polyprenyl-6-methoxyphenol hydroxylase-like FAD-dependent oxidoreductase